MSQSTYLSKASSSIFDSRYWIRGPVFDLSFITGGAFFTLFVAALTFQKPQFLPVLFWIWVVAFEGSHFWATFTRTYFDRKFRKENSKVLFGSLIFFLLPAIMIALESIHPPVSYTTIYGFIIFTWSLYHNARQHYGFLSIYSKKTGIDETFKRDLVSILYSSICLTQAYFFLNFKAPLTFHFGTPASFNPTLSFATTTLPIILSVLALFNLFFLAYRGFLKFGKPAVIPVFFILVCWMFYSTMFYFIAPRDLFVQNLSGAQTLMLIAIMNSLFHNIQYHAIVYHYGQQRYTQKDKSFGPARFINKNFFSYATFALTLGGIFGLITWKVGDWPNYQGSWQNTSFQYWAYILFFGIIGHHFYLDQKIWRPSQNKDLQNYLNLNQTDS